MPWKRCKKNMYGETRSKTDDFKSKFACILEVSESTIMRMEESLLKYHEGHIAGKGDTSQQHYNLVHKFIPMSPVMKIAEVKAAVDKEWEKTGPDSDVAHNKSQKQIEDDRWRKDEGT